jgi:hypothetical protein
MSTTETTATYEFRVFVPKGFRSGPPATAKEALQRTRALLRDEERWTTSTWYEIARPDEDPENPFCDDWKACLDGALIAVTLGAHRKLTQRVSHWDSTLGRYVRSIEDVPSDEREWDIGPDPADDRDKESPMWPIIQEARALIIRAANELYPRPDPWMGHPDLFASVPEFNDAPLRTRTDVMKVLDKAIKLA